MIKLKDILTMSFARKFKFRDLDRDVVVGECEKHTPGYNTVRSVYDEYEVVGIRAGTNGLLVIDIQKEYLL